MSAIFIDGVNAENSEMTVAANAAGITSASVKLRLSRFFAGLRGLGLADNFVDGGCYLPGFQSSASALFSLRGYASTVGGAPVLTDGGLKFDGADDSVTHTIESVHGAGRTILWWGAGNFTDGAQAAWIPIAVGNSTNPILNGYHRMHVSSVHSGCRGEQWNGTTLAVTPADATVTQNSPEAHMLATRDNNTGATTSLTANVDSSANLTSSSAVGVVSGTLERVIISALQSSTTINAWFKSTCATWLVFNVSLSDSELAAVKTLVEANLSGLNDMVVEGDSLSETGNWTNYALVGQNLWGKVRSLTNRASSGATVTAMLDRYAAQVSTLKPAGYEKWVALLAGTNDVITADGATIYARLVQWWALAKADGFKVCAFTIPRSGSGYNTVIDAANVLIRAAGDKYDLLVDADRFFKRLIGSDTYYTNATYFNADQVHLVNAGRSALGGEVARLLRLP